MSARPQLHFVVPDAIDDPARVSGGNVYDQHLRDELRLLGLDVRMIPIVDGEEQQTAHALSGLPDGALVLIDGLVAVRASDALVDQARRLRLIVLAHMVAGSLPDASGASDPAERERSALGAAVRVITTSHWTRSELIARDLAAPDRIVVAQPGTEPASATTGSERGGRLLSVGVVAPHKGHDLLIRALADLADVDGWTCTIVGSLHVAPAYVARLTADISSAGLSDRIVFTDVLTGRSLADAYASADLLIATSRAESYGMVVAEALAHGVPVLVTRVGGLPEAIAHGEAGIIVPPDDPWALGLALRQWWANPVRRAALKREALTASETTRAWSGTAEIVASTLNEVALTGSALSA